MIKLQAEEAVVFLICVISGTEVSFNGANKVTSICRVSCWMWVFRLTHDDLLPHFQRIHNGRQKIRTILFCSAKVIRCLGEPWFPGDVEGKSVEGISQNLSTLVSDKFVSINSYLKTLLYLIFHMGTNS